MSIFGIPLFAFLAGYPSQNYLDDLRSKIPFTCTAAYTGSMVPVLRGGETLYVYAQDFDALKVGDFVIAGTVPYHVCVCHEIIGGNKRDGFLVKGISSPRADPRLMTRENYVGLWRVLRTNRK